MSKEFVIKGFPTEISEYIELPDMAELMVYNQFYDMDADAVRKYGSYLHRYLLDKTPLRNDKKHVSVMSQVRIMFPDMRSCTRHYADPDDEWHIDSEVLEDGKEIYHRPTDTVHLLSNDVQCATEFNTEEFTIQFDYSKEYVEFKKWFRENAVHLIKPKKMPANKIVTFDNHIHRATNPQQIEFRYMFRVTETDRGRPPAYEFDETQNAVKAYDGERKKFFEHLKRGKGFIQINLPSVCGSMFKKYDTE